MAAKIDIDALKIKKIGKKIKTPSLNSRFTGSKKEMSISTCSLLKNFQTKVTFSIFCKFTHQQPQGRFTSY